MSNTGLIIEERSRDIGNFLVGRLLPFRKKRMVGPFVFIDHMGPSVLGPEKYMDVDQHPHIGLSTLTYLFEGQIEHRDSIGTQMVIEPGSVNWMTAGTGITHTERTPESLRNRQVHKAHGYQIWVALPDGKEDIEPSFTHIPANELPKWEEDGLRFILVAGEAYGRTSGVPVYSPLFMLDIQADETGYLNMNGHVKGEIGIAIVNGSITACDKTIESGNMLISKAEDQCEIEVHSGSHLLIFGGEPFEKERFIHWNFVASTKERIESAVDRWKAKEFPKVLGDDSYVPIPERRP